MSIKNIKLILEEIGIEPNKKRGQNFLIDKNLLNKIILESEITENDIILEVGGGLGALTEKLSPKAKKLYVYEIDYKLYEYLSTKFSKFNNTEIINEDILKAEIPLHNKVVSNIPYTITGPLFQKLFYKEDPPQGIMIIEKSLADRIFFSYNYKHISRISIMFNSFMEPIELFDVSSKCFYPSPTIKLSLVKVKPKKNINQFLLNIQSREFYTKFIAGMMPYKNKNLLNALKLYFHNIGSINITKDDITGILKEYNFENEKVFNYKINDFIRLSEILFNLNENKSKGVNS
ncbi:MAG: 16S rRNA (adenine(1518)-N(6)/adenine(1519)-N(6))-dimethyltransferase RsmA [Candidatus Hodarchaeota archaeon]